MEKFKASGYRWVVLGVYMYVAALSQLFWLNFTAIDTYVEKNLGVSAMSTGFLALVFPLVYLVLSFPAGIIIDKKGFKFAIGIGVIFTGVFSMLRLLNPESYILLLISQVGIAIGQPFILNGITKLVVVWFPRKEEATAVGLGSLSMFIGMIVGLGITPFLVVSIGFNDMLTVYSFLGIAGIVLYFLLVRANPAAPPREILDSPEVPVREGIRTIIKTGDFMLLGFVALIGIGVFNGLATWLEKILNELHQIPMVDAGSISAAMIFAGMLGCILVPLFSDRLQRRKPFLISASFVGTICMMVLLFQGSFLGNLANGIFLGFFLLSALPIMLTMSIEITGEKYAGISVAYLQFLGNGAAVIIVPVMELLHGVQGSYGLPLAFLAVLLLAAVIMSIKIRETRRTAETARATSI